MSTGAYEIHGVSVYECASDQHPLRTEGDANDLISAAREHNARFLIIRAEHLSSELFPAEDWHCGSDNSEIRHV
jgi:hypothetical protein